MLRNRLRLVVRPKKRSNPDIFERIRNEHSNDDNMQTRILNSKLRCPLIRSTDVTSLIFFGKIHLERLISYRNPGLFSVDFLFSTKTFFRRRIDASRLRLTAVVVDDYTMSRPTALQSAYWWNEDADLDIQKSSIFKKRRKNGIN